MRFRIVVDIDVDRVSGKFASRDEIEEALITMIEGANEGSVSGCRGGRRQRVRDQRLDGGQ